MEDALQFYCGYVQSKDASKYLSPVIAETIRDVMENNDNRVRSLLFKLAVEVNMACHTIAAHFRVDDIDRRALRAFAVDEVKKTNGQVSFDHALDVQRRIPVKDDTKWPGWKTKAPAGMPQTSVVRGSCSLAVELNMACHTIAAHFRVDDLDRRALRAFAVDEVKKTNGQVSFDHALDVQRRIPVKDDQKWPE